MQTRGKWKKKRKKKRGTFAQKVASTPLKLERALQTADLRFKVFFFLTDVLTHTLTKHRPGDGTGFWDCTCIDTHTHTQRATGSEKASQCKQRALTPHSLRCLMSSLQPGAFLNPVRAGPSGSSGEEPKPLN